MKIVWAALTFKELLAAAGGMYLFTNASLAVGSFMERRRNDTYDVKPRLTADELYREIGRFNLIVLAIFVVLVAAWLVARVLR